MADKMSAIVSRSVVTANDYSSVPAIMSWFTGVVVLLCVAVKLGMKGLMKMKFAIDDLAIILAVVTSIAMDVCVLISTSNGLGRHMVTLTVAQLSGFQKSIFASGIMYGITLFFSKASMLALLRNLTHVKTHRRVLEGLAWLLVVWLLTVIFCSAFQCSLPDSWAIAGSHCFDQRAFETYYSVTNIVTELILLVIPIGLIKDIRLPVAKKAAVIGMFELRAVVLCPLVLELYFQQRIHHDRTDMSFALWPVELCRVLAQGLSIVFACVPFMKPFFMSLHHCMTRVDDERRREWRETTKESSTTGWKSYSAMRRPPVNPATVGLNQSQSTTESDRETKLATPGVIQVTRTYDVRIQKGDEES